MKALPKQVGEFLSQRSIAVVGFSRDKHSPANIVLPKLRAAGHQVYAVNPAADVVDGEKCYPDVASVPGGVTAAFIVTRPDVSVEIVRQCARAGIRNVWLHRSFGQGSVSDEALRECSGNGIRCIAGGCPMMYCEPVDIAHRCMRWILKLRGRVPAD